MFTENQNKVIKHLSSAKNIDAFLVTYWADIFYLTGIELGEYFILVTKKGLTAISSPLLYDQLKHLLPDFNIIKTTNPIKTLREVFRENKIKSVGIDTRTINAELLSKLRNKILSVKLKEKPGYISRIRQVKSEKEVALIKKSCEITRKVLSSIKKYLKPGMREKTVVDKIVELFSRYGTVPSFTPQVASGINASYPHHIASDKVIEKNDVVIIDLGCRYKGYCSDMTRTFFMGRPDKLLRKIYNVVKEAQKQARRKVKSGVRADSVDRVARGIIKKYGFGKYFIHSTGHGVGIEVHEQPRLFAKDKTILKTNMVVTVEPGIYIPNSGGVRIEDTVLVRERREGKDVKI